MPAPRTTAARLQQGPIAISFRPPSSHDLRQIMLQKERCGVSRCCSAPGSAPQLPRLVMMPCCIAVKSQDIDRVTTGGRTPPASRSDTSRVAQAGRDLRLRARRRWRRGLGQQTGAHARFDHGGGEIEFARERGASPSVRRFAAPGLVLVANPRSHCGSRSRCSRINGVCAPPPSGCGRPARTRRRVPGRIHTARCSPARRFRSPTRAARQP